MNFLKYSNGFGHLIMSVVCIVTGVVLIILAPDSTTRGFGIALVGTVSGYWFVSSSAQSIAQEVIRQQSSSAPAPQGGTNGSNPAP